ncbi:hypothetical protein AGR4B_pAt20531 [Agrobacterium tumefaciens str. CFBP 5621]|nr:hypothetical protein AGR4B_pAt20531 [Agrobacterium tumefaciens str. CFBP 5621]
MLDFGAVFDRAPELLWATRGTFGLAFAGMALALVIGILGVIAGPRTGGSASLGICFHGSDITVVSSKIIRDSSVQQPSGRDFSAGRQRRCRQAQHRGQ